MTISSHSETTADAAPPPAEPRESLRRRAAVLAEKFATHASAHDADETYPFANVADLVDAGFMGMTIPKRYGGPGQTLLDTTTVIAEIARGCGVTGRIVVDANMGALGCVLANGPEWMKQRIADLVLGGDKPVIQITEPLAGTDALSMQTVAVVRGDQLVLSGTKTWITGARDSLANVVVCRLVEDGADRGVCAVYVERDTPGYLLGKRRPTMGLRGMPEMEVHLRDCAVPRENLVVRGFANVMSAYNAQRCGAAAVALGIAEAAYDTAVSYLQSRHQFGRPLADFQGLQWKMADARIQLDASRLLLERAVTQLGDDGFPRPHYAAIAKVFTAETAVRVTNEVLQVHGALGYSREIPVERMVRDARMFTIGGGTVEALRNLTAKYIFDRPPTPEVAGSDEA